MKQGSDYHTGSSFDDFLREEGLLEEAEAVASKRVIAWKVAQAMKSRRLTKQTMAKQLRTSRSQLERLLDPENTAVSLRTIARAARVLGKRLRIELLDPPKIAGGRRSAGSAREAVHRQR